MVSYNIYMGSWTITPSIKARNLVFSRVFGCSLTASNGILTARAYADYGQVSGNYRIGAEASYKFDDFEISGITELNSLSGSPKTIAMELTASSEQYVDGAIISLSYKTDDIRSSYGAITASCTVEF